jgi:pimeloyl-ACP methyl ester carboxylesterase
MKLKLLFLLFIILHVKCFAQESNIWGYVSRFIDAKKYAGRSFEIRAAVKVITINKNASAGIWARVYKTNKKLGFDKSLSQIKPISSDQWKEYSISGRIDKTADYMNFGINYIEQGIFYFDDFKLFIEDSVGKMQQIPLVNGDFEEDSLLAKHTWWYDRNKNQYNISLTTQEVYAGKQSCKVDGTILRSTGAYGDNDATGKYATVNGIKIYYEEYGKGQPLFLLHGNSASINSFRLQIPELSKYFHVYAIDTRGHGRSGDDGTTYTYDLFAADMNALLDQLHLDSVNIMGWSDGGNTGLIMAMQYPKKVKKLVTMGAVVFIDNTVVGKNIFKILHKEQRELANDPSAYAIGRSRRIDLLLTEPKHRFEELRTINCPVLIMAGEKDIVKEEHSKGIAANIPGATLLIVPKATHELPWEDAPYFNKAIIDFFQK